MTRYVHHRSDLMKSSTTAKSPASPQRRATAGALVAAMAAAGLIASGVPASAQDVDVETTYSDAADGDKKVMTTGEVRVVTAYSGLKPATLYTVEYDWGRAGTAPVVNQFMSSATGEGEWESSIKVSGLPIGENSQLTTGVYEGPSDTGPQVAFEDSGWPQYVVIVNPPVSHALSDKADGDNVVYGVGVVKDRISYENLIPGQSYTMVANWTGNGGGSRPVGDRFVTTFTASASGKGVVTVEIPIDSRDGTGLRYLNTAFHRDDESGVVDYQYVGYYSSIYVYSDGPRLDHAVTDSADGDAYVVSPGAATHRMSYQGLVGGATYTVRDTWTDRYHNDAVGTPHTWTFVAADGGNGVATSTIPVPTMSTETALDLAVELFDGNSAEGIPLETYSPDPGHIYVLMPSLTSSITTTDPGVGDTVVDEVSYQNSAPNEPYTIVSQWRRRDQFNQPVGDTFVTPVTASEAGTGGWEVSVPVPAGTEGLDLYLEHRLYRGTETTGTPLYQSNTYSSGSNSISVQGEQPAPPSATTTTKTETSISVVPSPVTSVRTSTTVVPVTSYRTTVVDTVVEETETTVVTRVTTVPKTVTSTIMATEVSTTRPVTTATKTDVVPSTVRSTSTSTVLVPTRITTTVPYTTVTTSTIRPTATNTAPPAGSEAGSVSGGGALGMSLGAGLFLGGLAFIGTVAAILAPQYIVDGWLHIPGLPPIRVGM